MGYATHPEVTLAGAQAAVDAAVARAEELGVRVVVVVTDRSGLPVAMARMDGAYRLSVPVARKKAWSVCAVGGVATADLWQAFGKDGEIVHGLLPAVDDLLPVGGGAPIRIDGKLAGAVGVSGATSVQDAEIAAAGAAAVGG